MAYRDFSLEGAVQTFELKYSEVANLFGKEPNLECSQLLAETLKRSVPLGLASNTQKSRAEMITAPILIELREQLQNRISLFSGIDFNVDSERGLDGSCDFLIGNSSGLLLVVAPVIIIVEAKPENLNSELGQCVAEMLAARIFNEREGNDIPAIFGAVTSGNIWKFLKLKNQVIEIDLTEYYLTEVNKILGILASAINN
ncbi:MULTISPECIES: hypothetical protein [unclassified Microcoleus]|uniref:hypothetical protein n=1 Tax=unclassified Microcoleus TaxID=2642155 RepID=UPI002FD47327